MKNQCENVKKENSAETSHIFKKQLKATYPNVIIAFGKLRAPTYNPNCAKDL